MYKIPQLKVSSDIELTIVVVITLLLLPWGIYLNSERSQENLYKKIYDFIIYQPLLWGLWVVTIAYFSIVKPSISIMLTTLLYTVMVSVQ